MVYDSLTYHPLMDTLIRQLDSVQFQNALLRLVQFLLKISYSDSLSKNDIPTYNLLKQIEYLIRFLRKPLKSSTILAHVKSLSIIISDQLRQPEIKVLNIMREAGYTGYLVCELISWLKQLNLVSVDNYKDVSLIGHKLWSFSLFAGVCTAVKQIRTSNMKKEVINKHNFDSSEKKKLLKMENINLLHANKQLLKSGLNLLISLNASKIIHIDDSILGLVGTVTSLMSLNDIWNYGIDSFL